MHLTSQYPNSQKKPINFPKNTELWQSCNTKTVVKDSTFLKQGVWKYFASYQWQDGAGLVPRNMIVPWFRGHREPDRPFCGCGFCFCFLLLSLSIRMTTPAGCIFHKERNYRGRRARWDSHSRVVLHWGRKTGNEKGRLTYRRYKPSGLWTLTLPASRRDEFFTPNRTHFPRILIFQSFK